MLAEKKLKDVQKELENIVKSSHIIYLFFFQKPESLKLTEKSTHLQKKLKTSTLNVENAETEFNKLENSLKKREGDIKALEKKLKEFERDLDKRKGEGVGLDEKMLKEYDDLYFFYY